MDSKRALARSLVTRFAGPGAAKEAEARFDQVHVKRDVPEDIDEVELPDEDPVPVPALLEGAFGISRSEARRLLSQGGVKVDGEVLSDADLDVPLDRLDGRVVQLGRRRFARFRRAS